METPSWMSSWQAQRKTSRSEVRKLLRRLKRVKPSVLNKMANDAHESVFEKVDCLQCANCCTSIPPIVTDTDIKRISKTLGMKPGEFRSQYLVEDDDGDTVMNQSPCPFLGDGNKCDIYDVRPRACRQYPHTDQYEFSKHFNLHSQNVRYCPAVYHIVQELGRKI